MNMQCVLCNETVTFLPSISVELFLELKKSECSESKDGHYWTEPTMHFLKAD